MNLWAFTGLFLLLEQVPPTPTPTSAPSARPNEQRAVLVRKPRPLNPVRLGGVFLYGLGDKPDPMENSGKTGTTLSEENRKFLTDNCDVVVLPANSLKPETYPAMLKEQPLMIPLLYLSASTLYEQESYPGNVGGWKPAMLEWTLRDENGKEIPHPDKSGHWMDMGSKEWAEHWKTQAGQKVRNYGAFGAVASELMLGNSFLPDKLQKYPTIAERGEATAQWLQRVHGDFSIFPSSTGFEQIVGHSVTAVADSDREPELSGKYWDYLHPWCEGAWSEGWLYPYWADYSAPAELRQVQLAAGRRASKDGLTFIATAAYHDDGELETLLAYFLLVSHKQGNMVFQPMPILPNMPTDAGLSLAVLKQQVKEKPSLLQAPLGWANEEMVHVACGEGRVLLRRRYTEGVVYVNIDDKKPAHLNLGSPLKRVTGEIVSSIDLAPNSGILLYNPPRVLPKKTVPKPIKQP